MAYPTVDDVLAFTIDGPGNPNETVAQQALDSAESFVQGYVRGRGKDSLGEWRPGLAHVVLGVAARIMSNPSGINYRDQAGTFSVSRQSSFQGFTLAELMVLDRYRKTAV